TRTLFVNNKGFASHHHIASGDDDLFINQVANNKNVTVELSEESFTYSMPKKNKRDWDFQKRRHLGTGKFYKFKHKILLGFYAMTQLLFFVSFIASLFFIENLVFAIPIFLAREIVMYYVYFGTCKKLKENDLIPYIFLFDFWLIFYHYKNFKTITIKTHQHWK
ncbi:MAG TPA: glycosyl transferase family 2, partial [Chitinophagaceae bacterium]|nr:glycosyl transferase family 2 [Chitinophagaceae bacterium]